MTSIYTGVLASVVVLAAFSARAEVRTFKAPMTAQAEVPANASGGNGVIEANFDTATRKLDWKGSYSGLSGPATAAHFHGPAKSGVNAGVALPAEAAKSPFSGSATLSEAQAADLAAGLMYFNIHTEKNPGGEIRGQLASTAVK